MKVICDHAGECKGESCKESHYIPHEERTSCDEEDVCSETDDLVKCIPAQKEGEAWGKASHYEDRGRIL